jgi:hypothetical protein
MNLNVILFLIGSPCSVTVLYRGIVTHAPFVEVSQIISKMLLNVYSCGLLSIHVHCLSLWCYLCESFSYTFTSINEEQTGTEPPAVSLLGQPSSVPRYKYMWLIGTHNHARFLDVHNCITCYNFCTLVYLIGDHIMVTTCYSTCNSYKWV